MIRINFQGQTLDCDSPATFDEMLAMVVAEALSPMAPSDVQMQLWALPAEVPVSAALPSASAITSISVNKSDSRSLPGVAPRSKVLVILQKTLHSLVM